MPAMAFYERDFVTRLGTLRVRVARIRQRAFFRRGWRDWSGARQRCCY
jgi:hypothetical protein